MLLHRGIKTGQSRSQLFQGKKLWRKAKRGILHQLKLNRLAQCTFHWCRYYALFWKILFWSVFVIRRNNLPPPFFHVCVLLVKRTGTVCSWTDPFLQRDKQAAFYIVNIVLCIFGVLVVSFLYFLWSLWCYREATWSSKSICKDVYFVFRVCTLYSVKSILYLCGVSGVNQYVSELISTCSELPMCTLCLYFVFLILEKVLCICVVFLVGVWISM